MGSLLFLLGSALLARSPIWAGAPGAPQVGGARETNLDNQSRAIGSDTYIYIFFFFFLFSDLGFRCLVVEVGQVAVGCMPILSLQGSLLVTLENEVVSRRYLLRSR